MPTPTIFTSATEEQKSKLKELAERHGLTLDDYYIGCRSADGQKLVFEGGAGEMQEIDAMARSMGICKSGLIRLAVRALMVELRDQITII